METVIENVKELQSANVTKTAYASQASLTLSQRYDRFIRNLEFSHYAVVVMAILIGSCLGSIAAMFVFYNGAPIWIFAIGLFASMANLVACIAQAPTKWVVNFFLVSVLVNATLIAVYAAY